MERAVHGLQVVFLAVHFHSRVHVLPVEVQVAARLPQPGAADMRRVHQVVPCPPVLLLPEILDDASDSRALGVPYDEPGPGLIVYRLILEPSINAIRGPLQDIAEPRVVCTRRGR